MRCGWAKRTSSPISGPGRVHAPVPPTIKGPNRPTCSVRSAPNAEPAPPSCCRPAIPKLCSFTSMRSQPKSLRALTLFSSSIKPGGMAPKPSRFQTTSRSCSFRRAHPNSTAKKISGNSCGRTGCRTEFSNPSTISSTTAATLGTHSSTSPGRSCPSPDAIGQQSVTQTEDWYYTPPRGGSGCQLSDGKIPRLRQLRFHRCHLPVLGKAGVAEQSFRGRRWKYLRQSRQADSWHPAAADQGWHRLLDYAGIETRHRRHLGQ